jgi:hypothetical protein
MHVRQLRMVPRPGLIPNVTEDQTQGSSASEHVPTVAHVSNNWQITAAVNLIVMNVEYNDGNINSTTPYNCENVYDRSPSHAPAHDRKVGIS